MSLSRPARFPMLRLPWLCIEAVVKCWDVFDTIFFALISKNTRRIVKSCEIPLNEVEVYLTFWYIRLGNSKKTWIFNHGSWFEERYDHLRKDCLVLQKYAVPFYTSRTNDALTSYTDGNGVTALKMVMEFLNEVFKCSVGRVWINDGNFPESGDIGVKSTVNLSIGTAYDYAQSQKLNLLLENLEVTGTCDFLVTETEKEIHVNPKLFKCRKLVFGTGSAAWVTREILMQFEVPQLKFYYCPFSVQDILSFVTNWFHSDNKKLEYLYIYIQSSQFSLEKFQTKELNPVPFSGRKCVPPIETYTIIDFSVGLEIVRNDGLAATIYVNNGVFLFYIWRNQ